MILIDCLRKSWSDLLQELSVKDLKLGDEIFANLIQSYSEPIRHYHNLEHIQEILYLLQQVKDISQNIPVLRLSAWFHDYIYDPQAKDNEELSAIYAEQVLSKLNLDSQIIYLITQIIHSTKNHQPLIKEIDNLIFLDIDLAILGTNKARYFQYAQAIRQEYSHLDNRDYQSGRTKVLNRFLTKQRIYYTDYFHHRLETTARKNIQAEIKLLNNN
ncbi:conserved hypothetical protein [Hyella patelloides LEGE 07179]|uniref:HD domain-containing protein n=1 Tax=Hyella patelloides LEGE 07179 TaxID=945734 RepID=A0A563VP53_9CYAN|nr:hypothetical protein [Hyella patelloides]VEP13248.1 conserved hypothetical protein [Hyella patelloides LEGE 07179]